MQIDYRKCGKKKKKIKESERGLEKETKKIFLNIE